MKTCRKKLHQYEDHLRQCPECARIGKKAYKIKNKKAVLIYNKEYRTKNKEEIAIKDKIRKSIPEVKEKISAYIKDYNLKNREEILKYQKDHYEKNKEEIEAKRKIRNSKPEVKAHKNRREKARKASDPLYKLRCNLATLIGNYFRNKGWKKSSKSQKILRCSFKQLKNHLESSAIKRYGIFDPTTSYHIDHIIPISLARNEEEILKLNHYSNLQYLTGKDNLQKSDKVLDEDGVEVTDPDKKIEILKRYLNKIK
jgi:hypothetical protein